MEQMPQILPLIQGAFSHFLPDQHRLKEPGRLDNLPAGLFELPVLDPDRDVAVAFDPGDVVDIDGAGCFHGKVLCLSQRRRVRRENT